LVLVSFVVDVSLLSLAGAVCVADDDSSIDAG
jgi:hypothetical protein